MVFARINVHVGRGAQLKRFVLECICSAPVVFAIAAGQGVGSLQCPAHKGLIKLAIYY